MDTLVLGSVLRAGKEIRINVQIQEADTGILLGGLTATGIGEESLFDMADQLGRDVRDALGVEIPLELGGELSLAEVTTDSIEAFRVFTEAGRLRNQFHEEEAISLLREAVERDPTFSLAWAELSVAAGNLGLNVESNAALEQAFAHRERLTRLERLRIEAVYYTRSVETLGKAVELNTLAAELDPRSPGAINLPINLVLLEMHEEALPHLEAQLEREPVFELLLDYLGQAYVGLGQPERAIGTLRSYQERHPDSSLAGAALGFALLGHSHFEGAQAEILRCLEERPGDEALGDLLRVFIASGQWSLIEGEADRLEVPGTPGQRAAPWFRRAILEYRGQTQEVVELWKGEFLPSVDDPARRQFMSMFLADSHLRRGEPEAALAILEEVVATNPRLALGGLDFHLNTGYWTALAEARVQNHAAAQRSLVRLRELVASLPGDLGRRVTLQLEGELALESGEHSLAIDRLNDAEELLPPGSIRRGLLLQHFRLWEVKGRAHLAASQPFEAADYFERMVLAGYERHLDVALWVQAHYQLADAYARLGREEEAREYYRRFYEMWKGADIRRDWVEIARSKLDDP